MKLGLHAYAYALALGLRDFQPVGRGALTVEQLLEKAAKMEFTAVQLARRNIPDWDLVTLVRLRGRAAELGLSLHLSTNLLAGEHLADMLRAANTLGATQVSVGLSQLRGNVKERQTRLERLLRELEPAIKTAERYKVTLALENGCHTAAADLAAFVQAAQSEWVGACFDMGNALTVPESPVEAIDVLAPFCKSVHLKDMQVYRTQQGITLINCPLGEGTVELTDVLRVLKERQPALPVFLQTEAVRRPVPLLDDVFLQHYPRITARSLAGAFRRGELIYDEARLAFPHERKASEREVLKWEEERLKTSLVQAKKLLGTQSLTLSL